MPAFVFGAKCVDLIGKIGLCAFNPRSFVERRVKPIEACAHDRIYT
jgi:hypothetical protein